MRVLVLIWLLVLLGFRTASAEEEYHCKIIQTSLPGDGLTLVIAPDTVAWPCSLTVRTDAPRPVLLTVTARVSRWKSTPAGLHFIDLVDVATLDSESIQGHREATFHTTLTAAMLKGARSVQISARLSVPGTLVSLAQSELHYPLARKVVRVETEPATAGGDSLSVDIGPPNKPGTDGHVVRLAPFDVEYRYHAPDDAYVELFVDGAPPALPESSGEDGQDVAVTVHSGAGRLTIDLADLLNLASDWTRPLVVSMALVSTRGEVLVPERTIFWVDAVTDAVKTPK